MASNQLVGNKDVDTFVKWGVALSPAVWPHVLRILFVIDGRIDTSTCPECFGLGYVLQTLRDDSFAWWVKFRVQVVRRDQARQPLPNCNSQDSDSNYNESDYTGAMIEPGFSIHSFRFTEPNFHLDDWDQVWFFGDYPSNQDGDINAPQFCPLNDAELKLLAEWMDRGGGVFAVGDHWNLGSSMCSRIPRVRTMRKWTPEQGVPPMDGNARHQTLQLQGSNFLDPLENDQFPQPIEVVHQRVTASDLVRPWFPHSLLSTPTGVVDKFPDHMHEGEIVNDNSVQLDIPLDIQDYDRPEYPFAQPQINPGSAARTVLVDNPLRPRPHVVAYGRTTNEPVPVATPGLAADANSPTVIDIRTTFGLVGAYDGDRVGIGRVVVDSTFHHWFTYNLHGFLTLNPPVYEGMQAYYRNVGIWLATPAQRQSMFVAATWGIVASDPMSFPAGSTRSLWAVGKKATEVMRRTIPPSMLLDFVSSAFSGRAEEIFGVPPEVGPTEPYASSVPTELAVRAMVGGIASSLIRPASEYLLAEGKPRRLLDPEAIARHAAEGFKQGHRALIDTLQSSATSSKVIIDRLEDAFTPSPQGPIPVDLIGVRVVAERLQIPDPTDPALVDVRSDGGKRSPTHFAITVRIALAGSLIAYAVIDEIEIPSFQPSGAVVDLNRVIYKGVVQSGEPLVVDVVAGVAGLGRVAAERVRFTDTLDGDPSRWIGPHTPSHMQLWRLWYRIEKTDDSR